MEMALRTLVRLLYQNIVGNLRKHWGTSDLSVHPKTLARLIEVDLVRVRRRLAFIKWRRTANACPA
jgi:hypothetical protein